MSKNLILAIVLMLALLIVIYMKRNRITAEIFNEKLSPNFTLGEMLVTSQPFPNIPNEAEKKNLKMLVQKVVQPARDLVGRLRVNSAFRSNDVNKAVGGVDNSQHRLGLAADVFPLDLDIDKAFYQIKSSKIPYDQIILETGKKGERWIHISYNPNGQRKQALLANWNFQTNKMDYKTA